MKYIPEKNKGWFFINILFIIYSVLAYLSPYFPPQQLWFMGFISYSIPVVFVINIFIMLFWLFHRIPLGWISFIILILGWSYWARSFQITIFEGKHENSFAVLSYNCHYFNIGFEGRGRNHEEVQKIIQEIGTVGAEIICFQEYYYSKLINHLNSREQFGKYGLDYFHFSNITENNKHYPGLGILSKWPIVNRGIINFPGDADNKAIYADLEINTDTLRVYNVHFYPLQLRRGSALLTNFSRLKDGFINRGKEADILKNHVRTSPYPVILCGDFNDLPYGYSYQSFRRFLNNSFEQKGKGFDFTFNGGLPLLRIDNQFASKEAKVVSHEVLDKIKYTDHFPVLVNYRLD